MVHQDCAVYLFFLIHSFVYLLIASPATCVTIAT